MSVRFEFTLSDEDAQEFIGFLYEAELSICDRMSNCDSFAEIRWFRQRIDYIMDLRERILKGQTRL